MLWLECVVCLISLCIYTDMFVFFNQHMEVYMAKNCSHCGLKLSGSRDIVIENIKYKSCPCCSQAANEHVFYPLDEHFFGFTDLRASPRFPDGRQSHCVFCRSDEHAAGECTDNPFKSEAAISCSALPQPQWLRL